MVIFFSHDTWVSQVKLAQSHHSLQLLWIITPTICLHSCQRFFNWMEGPVVFTISILTLQIKIKSPICYIFPFGRKKERRNEYIEYLLDVRLCVRCFHKSSCLILPANYWSKHYFLHFVNNQQLRQLCKLLNTTQPVKGKVWISGIYDSCTPEKFNSWNRSFRYS